MLEYWNIGDIAVSVLESLRVHYPSAHIAILTSPKCVPLLRDQGLVDEIMVVRVPWAQPLFSMEKIQSVFSAPAGLIFFGLSVLYEPESSILHSLPEQISGENFILWLARVRRRVGYAFGGGGSCSPMR